jgi:hypothetical protein
MPKMTAKYSAARFTALKNYLEVTGSQDDLYQRLQAAGHFWDSDKKTWYYAPPAAADPATPMIMVRVWADLSAIEAAAGQVVSQSPANWILLEQSPVYQCRPPKQQEGRIYLRFLPQN